IDPMTYIAKGAGSGLSKIGDITKGLKGIGNIEIPKLPDNAVTLPDGATMLPDGTFHLPDGAKVPDGGIELPNGSVKFPDDAPVLPEGTTKLPTAADDPIQYVDRDGNLLDKNGDVVQSGKDAPKEGSPTTPRTDTDTPAPHTNSPVREPVLAGVGARNGDDVIRLGSDPTGLGDLGRIGDDIPTGQIGDNLPTGQVGDNLPGGRADDLGHGPSNSHEPPTGGHGNDGPGPNTHTGDGGNGGGGGHQDPPSTGGHGGDGPGGHNDGPGGGGHNDGPGDGPGNGGGDHTPDNTGGHGDEPDNGGGNETPGNEPTDGVPGDRVNDPLPELTPQERADHWGHLDEVEQRSPDDFDDLQRDPDKNGGISEPSKDEARVGLDLRETGRLPDDIQRPTQADRGEFYSPSADKYYDIKGVHSDWPPFNNVRDKSQPFKGAYDPANNGKWVKKLSEQIVEKHRIVILDMRNASQAAIDDVKGIVERNGWEDDVIWYP
ncbi:hypothetical protein ACWD43_40500, partial [Streptomyces sp. NPDC002559]